MLIIEANYQHHASYAYVDLCYAYAYALVKTSLYASLSNQDGDTEDYME